MASTLPIMPYSKNKATRLSRDEHGAKTAIAVGTAIDVVETERTGTGTKIAIAPTVEERKAPVREARVVIVP